MSIIRIQIKFVIIEYEICKHAENIKHRFSKYSNGKFKYMHGRKRGKIPAQSTQFLIFQNVTKKLNT